MTGKGTTSAEPPIGGCVLDTNIYIQLSPSDLATLQAQEQRGGVTAYANPWAVFELLAHFEDETWPRSRAALKRLYQHCTEDMLAGPLRIMADSEDQLVMVAFGHGLPGRQMTIDALCALVQRVSQDAALSAGELQLVQRVQDHVHRLEHLFECDMQRLVLAVSQTGNVSRDLEALNGPAGAKAIARIMRRKAESLVGRGLPFDKQAEIEQRIGELFQWAICFWRVILRRVLQDGKSVGTNRNWVWDHQIAHLTSGKGRLDGRRVVAVSNDGALIEAATMAGMRGEVLRLAEYKLLMSRIVSSEASGDAQ